MSSIISILIISVVIPLLLLAHFGPMLSRGKKSFWLLSVIAIGLSAAGWANYYWNELAPENFSDVGSPWSMMLYTTLTSVALSATLMGALRVYNVWRPKSGLSWAGYIVAFALVVTALWVPVGFTGQRLSSDRWDAAYCETFTSNPKCNADSAEAP